MKYSELISFAPIESVVQLEEANDADFARSMVETYVMSDAMAESMKATVLDQLQMDEVVDNKGVLVVGNYGTGKSHMMSVISAIANDAENLQYLKNKQFAEDAKQIAGKFEVLRIEIGGVTMSLAEIICGHIQDDFDARGIDYEIPQMSQVRDIKQLINGFMAAFEEKYPDKGYLIVVDEFLSYLTSRNEREIVLDLEFLRALAERCSKSKLRIILGVQEKIFDNPKFSFVADTLKKVGERFTQFVITKEATAYVVSERILRKTPEQKAWIREHLEQYSNLYADMSTRMEDFVDLYPVHPAYIDVFNSIYLVENRFILGTISSTIKGMFDDDVPENAPGVISFDTFWPSIKNNPIYKSDPTMGRVINASAQLEDILNRSFPKAVYKPIALQIIYALSVHRLTTNGLDVKSGLTAENLKDDLCLYLNIPEPEADFLLSVISTTLRDIMTTVSGQFIIHNDSNNQYYIDVDKTVDYDEKVKQKASVLATGELNRYFYKLIYNCLEWSVKQYVTNFEIYEYDLNWDSHNMFREGYLFLGLPGERSTAQPERDFYIHIMPPYGNPGTVDNREDEVYFYFKSTEEFKEDLELYAAAELLATISEGKDKDAYLNKAASLRKKLIRYLSENKNTCFEIQYKGETSKIIEVLKGRYKPEMNFKDTVDLAASLSFENYFDDKYPDFPIMQAKITRNNLGECIREAYDHFAGRTTKLSTAMLDSFNLLDDGRIKPDCSEYGSYYIKLVKELPPKGVINHSDIFEPLYGAWELDKKFGIPHLFTTIILLSLVYAGYANMTTSTNKKISASELGEITKVPAPDLYDFKYIAKPAEMALAELKQLFEVLGINPALLDNPNNREKGVVELLSRALELSNEAVRSEQKLNDGFDMWGESLVNTQMMSKMRSACKAIKEEFSSYRARFNTPAKLNNFDLTGERIEELGKHIEILKLIPEYASFMSESATLVSYISSIETLPINDDLIAEIDSAEAVFKQQRDSIADGTSGNVAASKSNKALKEVKKKYIDYFLDQHGKKRLGLNDGERKRDIQEGGTISSLRKLSEVGILSSGKLKSIEDDFADLKMCYELIPEDLESQTYCPHCRFNLGDQDRNTTGRLDNIEDSLEKLVQEWTTTLLNTINDPLVLEQKKFLKPNQVKAVDEFVESGELPKNVDEHFVASINALLDGFDPVYVKVDELANEMIAFGPCDPESFKKKVAKLVEEKLAGKDAEKARIIVY